MNSAFGNNPYKARTVARPPYHTMAISMVYRSIDRKVYRDQYCIECGHPFFAISDKVVTIYDGEIPVDKMREDEKVIEARCRHHDCKQYYRLEV